METLSEFDIALAQRINITGKPRNKLATQPLTIIGQDGTTDFDDPAARGSESLATVLSQLRYSTSLSQ